MKSASSDGRNDSTKKPWPDVLQIASSDEFEQSLAVAQLAVKLYELSIKINVKLNDPKLSKLTPIERDNLTPRNFLAAAWELIQSAGRHVLRAQTGEEYLVALGGSPEAAEEVVGRNLSSSRVPFGKLCDPKRKKGDTETIELLDVETGETIEVEWRVYRGEGGERAFDNLFWDYWRDCGEQWKDACRKRPENPERAKKMAARASEMAALVSDAAEWRKRGKSLLASWKRDGVPPNAFLALARFRRERDNRAENLQKRS